MLSPSSTNEENDKSIALNEPESLNVFVKDLLDQMQSQVADVGNSIEGRMNEMGVKLGELEQSISSLMQEAGLEETKVQQQKAGNTQNTTRISEAL